jgi:hypothetical protein
MEMTKFKMIKAILADGNFISVWDGEEWQVKKSHSYKSIIDAIQSVEVAEIRIRDKDNNKIGWAMIVNGLDGEEEIADFTDNEYMNKLLDFNI